VDVAWHTIRSYIKGMQFSTEDDLDPADFADLPKGRQSVSPGAYRLIYERVWTTGTASCVRKEGYWHDQDLAASVLGSVAELTALPGHSSAMRPRTSHG